MSSELDRIDELASEWLAAWAPGGDFALCCAADVQYEDPLAIDPLRGPAALAGHAERMRAAFPDMRIERSGATLTGGDYACIPWRVAGTHRGAMGTLPATNRFLTLHGIHYLELRDAAVHRARGFFDLYDAATQLGLAPARGGIGETVLLLLRGFGLRAT